jgi:hypothetical protein
MSRKKKVVIIVAFALVVLAAGVTAVLLNIRATQEGVKRFQVEVVSERDGYHQTTSERSDLTYLGEYLRTMDGCQYDESEFGMFVTGWHGMAQDFAEEYWWSVAVNGEDAMVGVDDIPLIEGEVYTFTLNKGYF